MTSRHPSQRLLEANQADTWRPPTPYVAVLTRKVANVRDKESTIHEILTDLGYRIHPRREFFNAPLTLIEKLFSLTDSVPDTDSDSEDVIEPTVAADIIEQHKAQIRDEKLESIRAFLKHFREINPTVHKIQVTDLYGHYCTWVDEAAGILESMTQFGRLLIVEKSCLKLRTSKGFIIYVNPHRATENSIETGGSPAEE